MARTSYLLLLLSAVLLLGQGCSSSSQEIARVPGPEIQREQLPPPEAPPNIPLPTPVQVEE